MNSHDAVRTALRELAGEAQPVDLARSAVIRGRRRQRRQRQAATAVAAAVTAVVMVTGYLTLPGRRDAGGATGPQLQSSELAAEAVPSPVQLTTDGAPAALLTGWYAQGFANAPKRQALVLDAVHHRYVPVSADRVWPSSTGDAVAFASDDDSSSVSVTQFRTGKTSSVSVPGRLVDPQWSPDGRRLMFTVLDKFSGDIKARILSLSTGFIDSFPIGRPSRACVRCGLTWLPDGKRIALPQLDPAQAGDKVGDADQQSGVQVLSDTGTPLEFLGVHGWVTGTYSWSPDLRYVVVVGTALHDGHWQEVPMLVEVATGTVVREVLSADAYWVDNTRTLYVLEQGAAAANPAQVALRAVDGTLLRQWSTDPSWSIGSLARA